MKWSAFTRLPMGRGEGGRPGVWLNVQAGEDSSSMAWVSQFE